MAKIKIVDAKELEQAEFYSVGERCYLVSRDKCKVGSVRVLCPLDVPITKRKDVGIRVDEDGVVLE